MFDYEVPPGFDSSLALRVVVTTQNENGNFVSRHDWWTTGMKLEDLENKFRQIEHRLTFDMDVVFYGYCHLARFMVWVQNSVDLARIFLHFSEFRLVPLIANLSKRPESVEAGLIFIFGQKQEEDI